MIVKKLSDVSGGVFPGARYNEMKVAARVAHLMAMENVSEALRHNAETLHCFGLDASVEVERYLKDYSRTYGNTRTTRFQFHVSASVKGRAMSPEELTDFARELMDGMGYARQPYFVYAHHDTDNNRVHILSTRIKPNGYPISDHQDRHRPNECANHILAPDISKDIDRILGYDYETEGQFANIVKAHGYKIEKSLDGYHLFRYGGDAGNIAISDILNRITKNNPKRKDRATQLRAIIRKYKSEITEEKCECVDNAKVSKGKKRKPVKAKLNTDIRKILDNHGKPLSEENCQRVQTLIDVLKTKFGIDINFQKDKDGRVRGYGIIDHAEKIAFDGSKVMKLSELIDFAIKLHRKPSPLDVYRDLFTVEVGKDSKGNYMLINVKDGSTYRKSISPRQYAWYNGVKDDEREDVSLTIAATMFSEEILTEYLKRNPIHDYRDRIKSVSAVKLRNGNYGIRISLADGYIPLIEMNSEDTRRFLALQSDDKTRHDFLMHVSVHHLTHADAVAIKDRIRQQTQLQTRIRVLPARHQDFTPEISRSFAFNLLSALSSINIYSKTSGHNREYEVGKRSRYDDIDERQSGTNLSI